MPTLPAFSIDTHINRSPHVVLLGAGASKAAFPDGDSNGKTVPLMCELVECLGLEEILKSHGIKHDGVDFETLYNDLVSSGTHPDLVEHINKCVQAWFESLTLPESATFYDYLVLSLREKDLIATFNWDPFLPLAWERNCNVVKLPQMAFLHGNVGICVCMKDRVKDFMGTVCQKCGELLGPTPLLYPIKQKDYSSHGFINSEWNLIREFMKHAYYLTIFGYAAPTTDVEAKELLLNSWKQNPAFELAEIEIIDIKPRDVIENTWKEFFCRSHYGIGVSIWDSYLFNYPRRSCEALAMATLQNMPWRFNPFPRTKYLEELQGCARRLWEEEITGNFSGEPYNLGRTVIRD